MRHLQLIKAACAPHIALRKIFLFALSLFIAVITLNAAVADSHNTNLPAVQVRITHQNGSVDTIAIDEETHEIDIRRGDKIDVINVAAWSAIAHGNNYLINVEREITRTHQKPIASLITFRELLLLFDANTSETNPAALGLTTLSINEIVITNIAEALTHINAIYDPPPGTFVGTPNAGIGDLFGLIKLVSQLTDGPGSAIAARTAGANAIASGLPDPDHFLQMKAQVHIARESAIVEIAQAHLNAAKTLHENSKILVDAGRASDSDVNRAKILVFEANLELSDAQLRLALAVDAHENAFGSRLESRAFPNWKNLPPTELEIITRGLTSNQHQLARTYWRQMRHARQTLVMVDAMTELVLEVSRSYRRDFELGIITIVDLITVSRLVFDIRVQQIVRRADLNIAESWILAALGQFDPTSIERPEQP
jgi:hypothetical protein